MPITLELTTPIDDDRPIFVAGNFSEWYPDVATFRMQPVSKGRYRLTLPESVEKLPIIEYKYTRGNWDNTELDHFGNRSANRILDKKLSIQQDFVPYWRHDGHTAEIRGSMPILEELTDVAIPQLGRSRKVVVLLPADYHKNPEKRYPVLYMQDAQNLFGQGSAYGNWEIDKRLSLLAQEGMGDLIVVAIDHGDAERFVEYSPYSHPMRGKGHGMKYVSFIARNLKKTIDERYRTQPGRHATGIGGSSMGGLISIYAGFMYPEVFGRLMVFSPSLWVSPKIYFDAVEFFDPQETKIYLYGGGKEGAFMIPNIKKLKQTIEKQGHSAEQLQIKLSTNPTGQHNEKEWGQEFPKAVKWLFFQ